MFETLTVVTLSLLAFFFYQNMSLGLTSKVPKDPKNRVQVFAAQCLDTIKEKLANATDVKLDGPKVNFCPAGAGGPETLWSADGFLWSQTANSDPVKLNELGQGGKVTFEKLSETGLFVKIHAELDAQTQRDLGVRLTASFA